jgi:hypothetical protein
LDFSQPSSSQPLAIASRELGLSQVFLNRFGDLMNAKQWSKHNWKGAAKTLAIRHGKFYATRHTFITEGSSGEKTRLL